MSPVQLSPKLSWSEGAFTAAWSQFRSSYIQAVRLGQNLHEAESGKISTYRSEGVFTGLTGVAMSTCLCPSQWTLWCKSNIFGPAAPLTGLQQQNFTSHPMLVCSVLS